MDTHGADEWFAYVDAMWERCQPVIRSEIDRDSLDLLRLSGDHAAVIEYLFPFAVEDGLITEDDDLFRKTIMWYEQGTFGRTSFYIADAIESARPT